MSDFPATVYVPLLDEGIPVWRPVAAQEVSAGVFRLSPDSAPEDETWEFAPGAVVRCVSHKFQDERKPKWKAVEAVHVE